MAAINVGSGAVSRDDLLVPITRPSSYRAKQGDQLT
jgi:hypothetical protein